MKKDLDIMPKGIELKDFIEKAWKYVEATEVSSDILAKKPFNKDTVQQAKIVLGFLNAMRSLYQSGMVYYKLSNLPESIKYAKKIIKKSQK